MGMMPGNDSDFIGRLAGASESEVREAVSQLSPEAHTKLDRAVTRAGVPMDLTAFAGQIVNASETELNAVISQLTSKHMASCSVLLLASNELQRLFRHPTPNRAPWSANSPKSKHRLMRAIDAAVASKA